MAGNSNSLVPHPRPLGEDPRDEDVVDPQAVVLLLLSERVKQRLRERERVGEDSNHQ